jgi:hypothetical protein
MDISLAPHSQYLLKKIAWTPPTQVIYCRVEKLNPTYLASWQKF